MLETSMGNDKVNIDNFTDREPITRVDSFKLIDKTIRWRNIFIQEIAMVENTASSKLMEVDPVISFKK